MLRDSFESPLDVPRGLPRANLVLGEGTEVPKTQFLSSFKCR